MATFQPARPGAGAPIAASQATALHRDTDMLSPRELDDIEHQLRERRQLLLDEVRAKLAAARDPTSTEEDGDLIEDGDMALADLISHTSLAESRRDIEELQAIDVALGRIAEGSYGICVQCGREIEAERLKVQPTAIRCIVCQDEHERTYASAPTPSL